MMAGYHGATNVTTAMMADDTMIVSCIERPQHASRDESLGDYSRH